jgi:hypothetical protein
MAERPREPRIVDLGIQVDKSVTFELRTAEAQDERQSRLRREEAEAEHRLHAQAAEDGHKRRLAFTIHFFVMAIVTVAFMVSVYIAVAADPKTGLPDKAMGIITAIVAAAVGYITGKGSK